MRHFFKFAAAVPTLGILFGACSAEVEDGKNGPLDGSIDQSVSETGARTDSGSLTDVAVPTDAPGADTSPKDAASVDATPQDAGLDAADAQTDAYDAGTDASDSGKDASDAGPDAGPAPTPIAYYAFNEGTGTVITDGSGNANHGTHNAAYVTGKKGTALSFNGTTGAKVVGNAAFTWGNANADYTVEYWIWITTKAASNWVSPFHKSDDAGVNCCSGTQRTPAHYFNPGALTLISIMGTVAEPNHYGASTPAFPTGEWVHFATVHQGANQLIYINGQVVVTDVLGSPTVGGKGVLYLGNDTFYVGLVGYMDEVRIYNVALTQSQIQTDML